MANISTTHVLHRDPVMKSLKNDGKTSSCDEVEYFSEAEETSPLVVDQDSRASSPVDGKDLRIRRLPPSISPLHSPSLQSASPTFQCDPDILPDHSSSGSTHSPRIAADVNEPLWDSKPGLSFGIDRILGNSSRSSNNHPEDITKQASRFNPTTPIFSQNGDDEKKPKPYSVRHGSLSEDSSNCRSTPRSSAASPVEEATNRDLTNGRARDPAALEAEGDQARYRLPGVSAHGPSCPRPPMGSFRGFSAPGAGHLNRPGYQDIVAGHSGHSTSGPHNPYHSPGLFLPPHSDICRIEQRSPSSLSSLDLLPVRPILPDVFVCPWTGVQRDRFGLVRRIGHPYQNRTPPKRKKPRTAFTRQQVLELEKRFSRQKYLASAERSSLAKSLGMSDAQVKTWFQNRRTKWRRQTAEERDAERQAATRLMLSLQQEDQAKAHDDVTDPLCLSNSSLHALQNLRPWSEDGEEEETESKEDHEETTGEVSRMSEVKKRWRSIMKGARMVDIPRVAKSVMNLFKGALS
ncbi:hypothetical protein EGW08_009351 [Elysia chlorotica]|uniref:Homeobox domain-containing protein n=1 Tax=Elysia chlorotica TaxID=188477 RepID=A0A3S0ZU71_ELYCH|nr:hypothetical protein EGW08_009351 [Elysia chlorotica]